MVIDNRSAVLVIIDFVGADANSVETKVGVETFTVKAMVKVNTARSGIIGLLG